MFQRFAIPLTLALFSCDASFVNKVDAPSDTGASAPEPEDSGPTDPPDDGGSADDTAAPPLDISANHPRLFFSASDVPRLQAQIFDFERSEIVTTWDRYVSDWRDPALIPLNEGASPPTSDAAWGELVAPLPSLAMYALFTTDETVLNNALEWTRRIVALDEWGDTAMAQALTLEGICIIYDMLHDSMEPTDRMNARTRIIETASSLSRGLIDEAPWAQRSSQVQHSALMMAGLVTEHDYGESATWRAQARSFSNRTIQNVDTIADGSWPEGPSMASETLTHAYQSWRLMERHFAADLTGSAWLQARSTAMLRLARPGQVGVMSVGDGGQDWLRGPEHQTCFVDAYTSARTATWVREQRLAIEEGTSRVHDLWLEFLWCEPSLVGEPPAIDAPVNHHFEEWGVATWHSGFTAGDSSLLFKSGVPVANTLWADVRSGELDATAVGTAQLHPDAGSIGWYPRGQAVLTIGGTSLPKRTAISNTYTFTAEQNMDRGWGPAERSDWWTPSSFHDQVGNPWNVGQLGEWGLDYGQGGDLMDASAAMDIVDTRRGVTVMGGHFEGMYPTEFPSHDGWEDLGLNRLSRFVVVLPEEVVLILDHIDQSTTLWQHAHFNSTASSFSMSGSSGMISTPDGQTWFVDALTGGSPATDQLIQRVDQPSGPWVYRFNVSHSLPPGQHNHVYALRSSLQAVSLTGWSSTADGIEASFTVTNEGISSSYALRLATGSEPGNRAAFLGFSGFMAVTPGAESEIRF